MSIVYWEKQKRAFCGVHCVNSLLQNALFREKDFASFAASLDAAEAKIMGMAKLPQSHNVDANGNFSVDVLKTALNRAGMTMQHIDSDEVRAIFKNKGGPLSQDGYVLNLDNHWFAVRKLNGKWYNLDSLKPSPILISNEHLENFFEKQKSVGYTVFLVGGKYPQPAYLQDDKNLKHRGGGNWFDVSAAKPFKPTQKMSGSRDLQAGAGFIREAIEREAAGELEPALELYHKGISILMDVMKKERNENKKKKLREKVMTYISKAESLKQDLELLHGAKNMTI